MSNYRVLASDVASKAIISASTEAGLLVADNMKTDIKSQAWRSVGTSEVITLTWVNAVNITALVLPFTNLTNGATITVSGYTNTTDASPVWTTGSVAACPFSDPAVFGWDVLPPAANFFGYGSAVYSAIYYANTAQIKKLVVSIVDTANASGHIEIGRLLCGAYFEPDRSSEYGGDWTFDDKSTSKRNGAGDSITELKSRSKKITIPTAFETDRDRKTFMGIMRSCGTSKPLFIDAAYYHADYDTRQNYMIYGKFSKASQVTHKFLRNYATTVEIEEV